MVPAMAAAPSSYDELLYGRSISFSLSEASGGPECSICSEHYDDQDRDLIPRNLSCGHSMCSSEFEESNETIIAWLCTILFACCRVYISLHAAERAAGGGRGAHDLPKEVLSANGHSEWSSN